jgi:hypothetical protein
MLLGNVGRPAFPRVTRRYIPQDGQTSGVQEDRVQICDAVFWGIHLWIKKATKWSAGQIWPQYVEVWYAVLIITASQCSTKRKACMLAPPGEGREILGTSQLAVLLTARVRTSPLFRLCKAVDLLVVRLLFRCQQYTGANSLRSWSASKPWPPPTTACIIKQRSSWQKAYYWKTPTFARSECFVTGHSLEHDALRN